MSKPTLTRAELIAKLRAKVERNNASSRFSTPINIGPLMVRRGTG